MKRSALISVIFCCAIMVQATPHRLKGVVRDEAREPLPGVVISITAGDGQQLGCAVTKPDGTFAASFDTADETAVVEVGMLGYKTEVREIGLPVTSDLSFDLTPETITLKEVNVVAKPIRAQGDTLIYNVSAFKSGADNTIEDVIRRMPGISVSDNGSINYQGKPINNFYIEGLDMLQGRYTLATRNISADDIATVDVYENHQPVRVLEDIVYSDKAALNLTLKKKSLMRPIGRVAAGDGYGDGRGLWVGELSALLVSPAFQLMTVAKTNNAGATYGDEMSEHTVSALRTRTIADGVFVERPVGGAPLDQRRYDFNRSEIASVNGMSRKGENLTVGVNVSYDCNRSDIASGSEIAYFREGEDPVVINNDMSMKATTRRVKGGAVFSINDKSVFLKDRLSFDGSFRDNSTDVRGTDNVSQGFDLDNMAISNVLAFTVRRGQRVWDVRSALSYVRTPSGGIAVSRPGEDGPYMTQHAGGAQFYNSESTSMSWLIGSHVTVGGELMFRYNHESFESALEPERDDDGRTGFNDVAGSDTRVNVKPFFLWENRDVKYTVEVPLVFASLRYSLRGNNRDYRYSEIYPEINNSLNCRLGRDVKMTVGGAYRRSTGGLRNFITTPFYTGYRTLGALGNGRLGRSDTYSAELGLYYRNPLKALFASLNSKYSFARRNSTGISNVSDDLTASAFSDSPSNNESLSVASEISKRASSIGTTFKLSVSWNRLNSSCIRNEIKLNSATDSWMFGGSVNGSWLGDRIVGSLGCNYMRSSQTIDSSADSPAIDNVALSARISLFPHPSVELFGRFDYQYSGHSREVAVDQYFVDAGARYKIKKWDFELKLNNLAGQKIYVNRIFDGPDYISYIYRLRPMEAVAVVRMTF